MGRARDVYGLGGLLYHLLTRQPPFQADTLTTLLKQVIESEPISPPLVNPSVPRDLETICLKCLEKEPGHRYGTALELAEDLGRFLHDEPIRARPAGWAEKGWRWCRRRPALAALGLAVALLAVVASGVAVRLAVVRVRQDREYYYASIAQAQSLIQQGRHCAGSGGAFEVPGSTTAMLVQDVENPAHFPYFASGTVSLTAGGLGGSFGTTVGTVPVGKRVVLEYVAVRCETHPIDSISQVQVSIPVSSNSSHGIPILVSMQGNPYGTTQNWAGGGPVKIYAEYSQYFPIGFGFSRSNNTHAAFCHVDLFGFTINAP